MLVSALCCITEYRNGIKGLGTDQITLVSRTSGKKKKKEFIDFLGQTAIHFPLWCTLVKVEGRVKEGSVGM